MEIDDLLVESRDHFGLTQKDWSLLTGISRSGIAMTETGNRLVLPDNLAGHKTKQLLEETILRNVTPEITPPDADELNRQKRQLSLEAKRLQIQINSYRVRLAYRQQVIACQDDVLKRESDLPDFNWTLLKAVFGVARYKVCRHSETGLKLLEAKAAGLAAQMAALD